MISDFFNKVNKLYSRRRVNAYEFIWTRKASCLLIPDHSIWAKRIKDREADRVIIRNACYENRPLVEPFKKEQIELGIKARDFWGEAVTDQRRELLMQRSTLRRHKAILLT